MQFQFSVCMYGTCGRIDNKADFDFLTLTLSPCYPQQLSGALHTPEQWVAERRLYFIFLFFPKLSSVKTREEEKEEMRSELLFQNKIFARIIYK